MDRYIQAAPGCSAARGADRLDGMTPRDEPRAPVERPRSLPTILDVAALSGVSKSTVSNVLRDRPNVSDTTRERVRQAMQTLGYRPNIVARSLVQQRSSTIGVVAGDLKNTFYGELVTLMEQHATDADLTTVVSNTGGRAKDEAVRIDTLLRQRVSGIAMLQFSGDRETLSLFLRESVPVVMVSCWEDLTDSVAVDDRIGVRLAVDHLADLGHRHIGFVSSSATEQRTNRARLEGYENAMLRRGLAVDERFRLRWAEEALDADAAIAGRLRELMEQAEPRTAFIATTDVLAIGLIEALEALGHRVPEDVSVVGFDGIAFGALSRIALTTVAQPTVEMAATGMELLLRRIRGDAGDVVHRRLLPELVVRGSTAPPPAA
jgi:LacI family transcriptional regulator